VVPPDHAKCEAMVSTAIVNQATTINVTLCDSDSNPVPDTSGELHVIVEAAKNNVTTTVKPITEVEYGKYVTSFIASGHGDHIISILVSGKHIPGSPYKYV